uniref:Uncharacterized protein n=1 Tax=Panagrellus redivivus TaxID=6233 RepID=A0A7E5A1W8_PANRE
MRENNETGSDLEEKPPCIDGRLARLDPTGSIEKGIRGYQCKFEAIPLINNTICRQFMVLVISTEVDKPNQIQQRLNS